MEDLIRSAKAVCDPFQGLKWCSSASWRICSAVLGAGSSLLKTKKRINATTPIATAPTHSDITLFGGAPAQFEHEMNPVRFFPHLPQVRIFGEDMITSSYFL